MHHTIIAVDVEGFGSRSSWRQLNVRDGLHKAVRSAFDRCGIPWQDCHAEDRGDGLLVLAPPNVQNGRLVECLPNEIAGRLREHNATTEAGSRIRLRLAVHAGEVEHDQQGVSGPALVLAFRLLNAVALKDALAHSHGVLALITSAEFYHDVVANYPAANPGIYRQVRVLEKETHTTAWICLPDNHIPAAAPAAPARIGRHRSTHRRRDRTPRRGGTRPLALTVILTLLLAGGQASDLLAAAPPNRECPQPVQLNLTVSADLAPAIQKLMPSFTDKLRRDGGRGCKVANVQVTAEGSADGVVEALRRGWTGPSFRDVGPQPHVWLPESSWVVDAAKTALDQDGRKDLTLANRGSVASSPLVVAKAAARSVPDQSRGWRDLLAMAQRSPSGQEGLDLRRPNPVSSGSGLAATIALYAAELGPDLDANAFMADQAPGRLHDIERSISASDDQSDALLCSLRHGVGNTAVLVSEKAAGDYADSPAATCPPEPGREAATLELSYPRDGTLYLDHPFVVVDWNNRPVNTQRGRVIQKLFEFLVGRDAQTALRRERFRDRDGYLEPFDGALPGRPAELRVGRVDVVALLQAFHDARKAARALFLVDVSKSMGDSFLDVGGSRLTAAADAINRTLESLGPRDRVGVWRFARQLNGSSDFQVLVPVDGPADGAGARSGDPSAQGALTGLQASQQPARLRDTLLAAARSLRESSGSEVDTRDAIVVIADGTTRESGTAELVGQLRSGSQPIPVFMIAFGSPVCSSPQWQEISRSTGGACWEVGGIADINNALNRVAAALWGGNHG